MANEEKLESCLQFALYLDIYTTNSYSLIDWAWSLPDGSSNASSMYFGLDGMGFYG